MFIFVSEVNTTLLIAFLCPILLGYNLPQKIFKGVSLQYVDFECIIKLFHIFLYSKLKHAVDQNFQTETVLEILTKRVFYFEIILFINYLWIHYLLISKLVSTHGNYFRKWNIMRRTIYCETFVGIIYL